MDALEAKEYYITAITVEIANLKEYAPYQTYLDVKQKIKDVGGLKTFDLVELKETYDLFIDTKSQYKLFEAQAELKTSRIFKQVLQKFESSVVLYLLTIMGIALAVVLIASIII